MNMLDHRKPHQKYFEEISRIPRGSRNEAACADYLEEFAKAHGLKYLRDAMHNVIIYKPATSGYENHEAVILQAHTDMVCEKNVDCTHDFTKDPIDLYIEDGILKARGTTLGADDGMGCAYMMALLAGDGPHPALECVFTVQEEIGLYGAFALKPEYFTGRRYINLDFGGHGAGTCTTSAGGEMVTFKKPVKTEKADGPVWRIFVTGLAGGHSGGCIGNELGNSLKICSRLIKAVADGSDLRLMSMNGGDKDNAIPRECEAMFVSNAKEADIRAAFEEMAAKIKREIEFQEPGFTASLMPVSHDQAGETVLTKEETESLVGLLYLLPHGLRHKSLQIKDLPTASENFASIRLNGGNLKIQYSLRAEKVSLRDQMEQELLLFADLYHFETEIAGRYPSWEYNPNSAMRNTLRRVFKEQRDLDMEEMATHGGLECGIFCDMLPGLDVVTLGAEAAGAHTPNEQMNLASFDEMYDLLAAFLKEL